MSKESIAWHKECLKNQTAYIKRLEEERDKLNVQIGKLKEDACFLTEQITTAELRGLDGFDEDRFLVKHKTKEV